MPIDFTQAFIDPEGWRKSLAPDQATAINEMLRFSQNPGDDLNEFLAVSHIAQNTGLDAREVSKNFGPYYRDAYALSQHGLGMSEPPKSDGDFYRGLKEKFVAEKKTTDLKSEAFNSAALAAISGQPLITSLRQWQGTEDATKPSERMDITPHFMRAYSAVSDRLRPYKGAMKKAVSATERLMDGRGQEGDDGAQMQMIEALLDMPKEDRSLVLQSLRMEVDKIGKAKGEEKDNQSWIKFGPMGNPSSPWLSSFFQQTGESAFRISKGLAVDNASVENALAVVPTSGRQISPVREIRTLEDAQAFVDAKMSVTLHQRTAALAGGGTASVGGIRESGEEIELTPEAGELIKKVLDRENRRIQLGREWGALENGIDPITSDAANLFGSTGAIIGVTYLTRGRSLPLMARGYTNLEYDKVRLENPNMAIQDARLVTALSGFSQAALDQLGVSIFTKLPGLNKLLQSGVAGTLTGRAAGRFLGVNSAEAGIEVLQDLSTPVFQTILATLKKDVPAYNWDREKGMWSRYKEHFITMIPLTLVFSGVASLREYNGTRNLLQFNEELGALGIVEADRVAITDAIREGDTALADSLMRDSDSRRDPAIAAEYQEKLGQTRAAEMTRASAAITAAEDAGQMPRVRVDANGFTVEDMTTGEKVKVATREEALELVYAQVGDKERQSADAMAQMAEEFISTDTQTPSAFEFRRGAQEVNDEVAEGRVTPEQAVAAAVLYGQMHGLTEEEARAEALTVLGNNRAEMVENVRTSVSRMFGGSSLITVMHEGIHGRWRSGLEKGHYNHGMGVAWVRMAEEASGVQFLPTADNAAVTPEMLDEAIVETAVADLIGRRKDGKQHFTPGLISQGIAAFALSERENAKEASRFGAFLKAWKGFWGKVLGNAKSMQKARREGKLGDDFDMILDDLLGTEPQQRHEAAAAREAEGISGEIDNVPFSLTARIGGSRAAPADSSNVTELNDGAALIGPTAFSITAYHGTPHKVDKFSTNKIGTGEGAQAFGWGLYFAGNREVAQMYARAYARGELGTAEDVARLALSLERSPDAAIASVRAMDIPGFSEAALIEEAVALIEAGGVSTGNVYTVDLLPDESEFLDWDKPLSEQTGDIRDLLEENGIDSETANELLGDDSIGLSGLKGQGRGSDIYSHFGYSEDINGEVKFSPEKASKFLASIGIPGIRFLDGDSRKAGEGSYNYVLFDESLVKIIEENGQSVELGGSPTSFSLAPSSAARDAREITPIEITTEKMQGDRSDWRKVVRDYISAKLQGRILTNKDTGWGIGFNSESKGESISKLRRESGYRAALHFEQIVEESVLLGDVAPQEKRANDTERFHYFAVPVIVDGNYAVAWFNARKILKTGAVTFYEFGLHENATQTSPGFGSQAQGLQAVSPISGPPKTIGEFISEIKTKLPAAIKVDTAPSFSLAPRSLATVADTALAAKMRKPEFKEAFYSVARGRLAALAQDGEWRVSKWGQASQRVGDETRMSGARTTVSIETERKFRQRSHQRELLEQGLGSLTHETMMAYEQGLHALEAHPLIAAMLRDNGKLMSRSEAEKGGKKIEGDYDGVPWLPPGWYAKSAGIAPDVMAQSLHDAGLLKDAYVDTLWDALRQVINSTRSANEAFTKAKTAVQSVERKALTESKAEAEAWAKEAKAKIPTAKERQLMALRTLDAILSAFPAEVRGKVGGFVKLASLGSDKAREAEIARRIEKLEEVLEEHAQNHFIDRIEALFEKGKPKNDAGKKPKGKLGPDAQTLVDLAQTFSALDEAGVTAERAAIYDRIEKENDTSKLSALAEREHILDLFGDMKERTSAELESAHDWLKDVYTTGRNQWKTVLEDRIAETKKRQAAAVKDTGKQGLDSEQQAALEQAVTVQAASKGMSLSWLSFEQVMHSVLGRKSDVAKATVRAARVATTTKTDAVRVKRKAFRETMASIFGTEKRSVWQRKLWDLSQIGGVTVTKMEGARTETREVAAEAVKRIIEGTADAKAFGLDELQTSALADAWDANERLGHPKKGPHTKKTLTFQVPIAGTASVTRLSELQSVHITMLARQAGYAENMAGHGWTEEVLTEIEGQFSDEAKAIRDWLAVEYATGYDSLNSVYKRMYGLNLPRLANYAPGTFEGKDMMGTEMDPYGQGLLSAGGFKAGMLKTRAKHSAKPRLEDALAVYWGHVNATEHFKAFGEFARDLRGVMNDAGVRGAIQAKGGKDLLESSQRWIEVFERNGLEQRAASSRFDNFIRARQSTQAYLALAYNTGTLMKQSTAAFGSLLNMGPSAAMRQMGRLFSGQLDLGASYRSAVIQRRLDAGYSPEVRQSMAASMAEKPTWGSPFIEKGMETIGMVDAIFTTASHAMAWDHHYNEALQAGLNEEQARRQADMEAEATVARTAQPSEMMDRSLTELGMAPMGRFLFMFASEARQKAAIAIEAYSPSSGLSAGERASRLIMLHVIFPIMIQTITNVWRDDRDDDDDELFDEKNWQVGDYAKSMLLGPLMGIPIIGGGLNAALSPIFGGHYFANDPTQPLNKAAGASKDIYEAVNEGDMEAALKGSRSMIWALALAMGGSRSAAVGVGASALYDAVRVVDNVTED